MAKAPSRAPLVALIGNPNAGKSTLFNALTGLRQRIGNYPGVTVERKSGWMTLPDGERVEVLDLPGLYSLAASSPDERIVIDTLCGRIGAERIPDAVVCVVDCTNLLRNLFLASQVAELGIPMMLVLNQADVARKRGVEIDTGRFSERLGGIPVVPASAWHGEGIASLKGALAGVLEKRTPMRRILWNEGVAEALRILREGLMREKDGGAAAVPDAMLQRMIFDATPDPGGGWLDGPAQAHTGRRRLVLAARERIRHAGLNPFAAEAVLHYERMGAVIEGIVVERAKEGGHTFSQRLDEVLLSRILGTAILLVAMAGMFASVFWLAEIPKGWLETLFAGIGAGIEPWMEEMPALRSLVIEGVIGGVGAFMSFLPQILILFFFITLLENTGYMARAAFLMDRLFSWCGLNGKCFVPMLSGYACAVPSVLATRTIEDPRARVITIFLIPFMSCSARLPVYTLMTTAFVVPQAGAFKGAMVMVGMYLVGLVVAIPVAWVLTRVVLRIRVRSFVLELPRYQIPRARDVLWRMWQAGAEFVKRAGTIIFAITVIVWALLYFPHTTETAVTTRKVFIEELSGSTGKTPGQIEAALAEESATARQDGATEAGPLTKALEHRVSAAHIEDSYLGRFGKAVQPVFAPAGFDWKITVGVLASFPAREVIVSTLGITYSLGAEAGADSDALHAAMAKSTWKSGPRAGAPIFTIPVVMGIMVFFALCSQCGATLAVIAKEAGWRWAAASFVCMTTLAWLAAVACYQAGRLLGCA
ncbi:MAG: ferrous iron transport protein B [Puniceicoccales bacterium]|jgi:ferrous iron transport protein B|nr:ferrous iron transport protein B [Puniceicoccales bacterium]